MNKGKIYFLIVSVLLILEQIILMIAVYNKIGNEKLYLHIFKILCLISLLLFIYFKGSKIALWILSTWYIFGGIFAFGEIDRGIFSIYTAMFVFYVGIVFFIHLFPPITKFIESKRQ